MSKVVAEHDTLCLLEDVVKTYKMGEVEVHALNHTDLLIRRGEFVAILGPSGSGKTTLLNLIGGIDSPTAGRIVIDGEDISTYDQRRLTLFRREKIGFVFQFFNLIPTLTARENVEFALELAARDGVPSGLDSASLLAKVGLSDRTGPLPVPALRRRAAARRGRPRAGQGPRTHPRRRAHRQPRLPYRQARARRAEGHGRRRGQDGPARHAQPAARAGRRSRPAHT